MLKIIGIIGLVISCGLFGISRSTNMKIRIELLEEYYEMIMQLKGQINYFKEPLPELFTKLAQNDTSKAYMFLKALCDEIDEKGLYKRDLWAKKLKCVYQDTVLTNEDIEIMTYLGDFIGQTDYYNQIQHFSYIEENLKAQIEKAKSNYKDKGPLYNKIGFFLGAIIGILLI